MSRLTKYWFWQSQLQRLCIRCNSSSLSHLSRSNDGKYRIALDDRSSFFNDGHIIPLVVYEIIADYSRVIVNLLYILSKSSVRHTVIAIAYSSITSNFLQFRTRRSSRPINADKPPFPIVVKLGMSHRLSTRSFVKLGKAFTPLITRIGLPSKLKYSKAPVSSNGLGKTVNLLTAKFNFFKYLREKGNDKIWRRD